MDQWAMARILGRLGGLVNALRDSVACGAINDAYFNLALQNAIQDQHAGMVRSGIPEICASLRLHAAVLILGRPGLRSLAAQAGRPLEVVENHALREAAQDIAQSYGRKRSGVASALATLVVKYGG